MRFAIFGNTYQAQKAFHTRTLLKALESRDAEIFIARDFYEFLVSELKLNIKATGLFDENNFDADMVICIGGDGTFLKAANRVGRKGIPILGINTGRLGFLADVSPEEIESTIDDIYQQHYTIEEKSVIQLVCEDNKILQTSPYALNEIAVLKRDSSSMITIHTSINGENLITYQADGLILATPTGSTAYSLSVGGPILVPQLNAITITPVAPHSLNVRPVVIRDDWEITLDIESRNHSFLVAIDGRNETLKDSNILTIRKADYMIKVVKRADQSFFKTLRGKMMWGIDSRDAMHCVSTE
ncbi:NAD kinase [Bacteroides sp. 519]|uniref:NAD kinase n=1 Tax=Bacteroides sp. 519 TaxID=2302937 RepID=UPI0013D369CA|nr:NAD kinase [Bacteroides sp. 519]NDV57847.1 NAD kinase [Bacteroides sp. 519]